MSPLPGASFLSSSSSFPLLTTSTCSRSSNTILLVYVCFFFFCFLAHCTIIVTGFLATTSKVPPYHHHRHHHHHNHPLGQNRQSQGSRQSVVPLQQQSTSTTSPTASPGASTSDTFLRRAFMGTATATECDDVNVPPALNILLRSLDQLTCSGTDIRGKFVDHARLGSIARVAHEIGRATAAAEASLKSGVPALTPLSAHCLGRALAELVQDSKEKQVHQLPVLVHDAHEFSTAAATSSATTTICIGVDPRPHSMRLADAFARGAESLPGTRVLYTGLATTPACASFLHPSVATTTTQRGVVDASIMVTASHLPLDRNGFKIFLQSSNGGGGGFLSHEQLRDLGRRAKGVATELFSATSFASVPPTSGANAVMCSQWVDWMPQYADSLKQAILVRHRHDRHQHHLQQQPQVNDDDMLPLKGLSIVLNAGNGSGGFFAQVLKDLGADVSGSIRLQPDATFPHGIPNPEYAPMIEETIRACQVAQADLGIMLDTDADRCGLVVPTSSKKNEYEPLNRNRLIALVGVMFAETSPGCAIVTDSVTSEGLTLFLQDRLGLQHVRYIKGYANVITKARDLAMTNIANAQVAIETTGHCAMQENRYLDDGTYTAAKVVSLLASNPRKPLRDWIADYQDLNEVCELRMTTFDKSLATMQAVFDFCAMEIEQLAAAATTSTTTESTTTESNDNAVDTATATCWQVDTDNLEGIRIRIGDGQFFMLRKSLHDPIISLQIEAHSKELARKLVVAPLLRLFECESSLSSTEDGDDEGTASYVSKVLDLSVLRQY